MSAPKVVLKLEFGDQDDDGKVGVVIRLSADIPFDGKTELRELIHTMELEPPIGEFPDLVKTAANFAARIARFGKK